MACRQLYSSRSDAGISAGDVANYVSPTNAVDWTTALVPGQPWRIASTGRSLGIRISVAPGLGKSFTYTLMVDTGTGWSDTAMTCTIADLATTGSMTAAVDLPAGSLVLLRRDSIGAPTIGTQWVTFVQDGKNPGESYHGIANFTFNSSVSRNWAPFSGFHANANISKGNVVAVEGQLTGYTVVLDAAAVPAAGKSYKVGWYKNGVFQDGTNGTIDTTLLIDSTTALLRDWTGSLPFAPGTQAYFNASPSGTPANLTVGLGLSFLAVNDGESNVGFVGDTNMPATAGTYFERLMLNGGAPGWSTTESDVELYNDSPFSVDLRGLFAKISGATANALTCSIRQNESDPAGGPTTTVAAGQSTNADVTGSFTLDPGDRFCFQNVQAGSVGTPRLGCLSTIMIAQVASDSDSDVVDGDFKVTLDGLDITNDVRREPGQPAIQIVKRANDVATAALELLPGVDSERFQDLLIYSQSGLVPEFGGLIITRELSPAVESGPDWSTKLSCKDFLTYLDWTYVSVSYDVSVSLKRVLSDIVSALPAGYGVILAADQADGPTLDPFTRAGVKAADLVRELSSMTNYVATMSPFKALKMAAPGATSAPFSVTDADPHCVDLTWKDPQDPPVNTVRLRFGPDGPLVVSQTWIEAGGADDFVTDVAAADGWNQGYVHCTTVANGEFDATSGNPGDPGGPTFTWDWTTSTLTVNRTVFEALYGPLADGDTLEFVYTAQFPAEVIATTGASPQIESLERNEGITELAVAQAAAAALLAQKNQQPREVSILAVNEHGLLPGMGLVVNRTDRAFNATCTVSEVQIDIYTEPEWVYTVKAQETTTYNGNFLDQWQKLLGSDTAGVAVAAVASMSSVATLSPPWPIFLGGSREGSVPMAGTPAYTPILNYVEFTARTTFNAQVRVDLKARTGGVGVKARLYNVTDATAVAESSLVTSTSWTGTTFTSAVVAGKTYRVDVISDTASEDAYAAGAQLEAA